MSLKRIKERAQALTFDHVARHIVKYCLLQQIALGLGVWPGFWTGVEVGASRLYGLNWMGITPLS